MDSSVDEDYMPDLCSEMKDMLVQLFQIWDKVGRGSEERRDRLEGIKVSTFTEEPLALCELFDKMLIWISIDLAISYLAIMKW